MTLALAWICLVIAGVAAVFCVVNRSMFHRSAVVPQSSAVELPAVSVLIPARNEEAGIRATLERVLAQQGVKLEVLVLDDHSTDRTSEVVQSLVQQDSRLRLLTGDALPAGWSGKQFACQQLADAARSEELVFLDADVHLEPDAISRAVGMRRQMGLDLLSGFPRQQTGTTGERLLIPLINYVLICYLPFPAMRRTTSLSACAGCGQMFATGRTAYRLMGGHAAVKSSLHDGVMLPRAYRRVGLMTDVFDAGDIAAVRMYHGLKQTWQGLAKNATEGFANSRLIVPVTVLLMAAHVLPWILLLMLWNDPHASTTVTIAAAAGGLSLLTRGAVAVWFDRQWLMVLLHPISIMMFLWIQWSAWLRSLRGGGSDWRGRTYISAGELST